MTSRSGCCKPQKYQYQNYEDCSVYDIFERIFHKLYEDLIEAYLRTPQIIASKPYIERALRLTQAGLTLSREALASCGRRDKL